jgi:hypothetical protein
MNCIRDSRRFYLPLFVSFYWKCWRNACSAQGFPDESSLSRNWGIVYHTKFRMPYMWFSKWMDVPDIVIFTTDSVFNWDGDMLTSDDEDAMRAWKNSSATWLLEYIWTAKITKIVHRKNCSVKYFDRKKKLKQCIQNAVASWYYLNQWLHPDTPKYNFFFPFLHFISW